MNVVCWRGTSKIHEMEGVKHEIIEAAAGILEEQQDNPIEAIGSYISEHIEGNWQTVLTVNQENC